MATKPLDKMSKPELVKALKAAHKRIAKLEATIEDGRRANVVNTTYDPPSAEEVHAMMFPWNDKPEEK